MRKKTSQNILIAATTIGIFLGALACNLANNEPKAQVDDTSKPNATTSSESLVEKVINFNNLHFKETNQLDKKTKAEHAERISKSCTESELKSLHDLYDCSIALIKSSQGKGVSEEELDKKCPDPKLTVACRKTAHFL